MKLLYSFFLISLHVQGEIYKCTSDTGKTQFKDIPCENQGEVYTPKPVMTPLTHIKVPKATKTIHSKKITSNTPDTCPRFTSTELRNLKVKDEFKKGLSTDYIKKRLGKPDSTESSGSNEKWRYRSDNVWREFKFKQNCLISWKANWRKGESKLSKYRD